MANLLPEDILNVALLEEEGQGIVYRFRSTDTRERMRYRLYAKMRAEKTKAETAQDTTEFSPSTVYPWADVQIARVDDDGLWVGRAGNRDQPIKKELGVSYDSIRGKAGGHK